MARARRVLFLCTGNSARSILAEGLLNHLGGGRFEAFSAGSFPTGRVNPHALAILAELGAPTEGFRSKSWDEFAAPGMAPMDFVITVCDQAAGETCPVWPGAPVTAHWGVADPARAAGGEDEVRRVFREAAAVLRGRIERMIALPIDALDARARQARLREIGAR